MRVRKKTRTAHGSALVACDGVAEEERERVENLVEVLGAKLWEDSGVPDLVIAGSASTGIEGIRRVEVGADFGLHLPGDEELLAQVILASCTHNEEISPSRVIAVAHWEESRCSTVIAQLLAQSLRGVLIDLSGSGPFPALLRDPDAPGIRWADVSRTENTFPADLPEHLVKIGRYRVLTADERGGARLGDSRLGPVVDAVKRSGTHTLIFCGLWEEGSQARLGAVDGLVLVGPADFEGAARAAFALALSPPPVPYVLIARGRGSSRLRAFTTAPVLTWARALRGGGQAILHALKYPSDTPTIRRGVRHE